jgi:hypothetical protein
MKCYACGKLGMCIYPQRLLLLTRPQAISPVTALPLTAVLSTRLVRRATAAVRLATSPATAPRQRSTATVVSRPFLLPLWSLSSPSSLRLQSYRWPGHDVVNFV